LKEVIRDVAVRHFNAFGYEGVKMNKIAEEVGIRKQSLAYHYPAKRDLLLVTYKQTVQEEIFFLEDFFQKQETNLKELLLLFLKETESRYYKQPNVAFLQIMSFRSPIELNDLIISYYREYLHVFKKNLIQLITYENELTCTPEEFAVGFITMFDGLIIQLVYEDSRSFKYASQSSFSIFWKGINK
jgi:TetR/AcrR family transcriptional regulator, biofilm operon repressor